MRQLRLNEHYTSVQGEGPHTGEMTQFVRFSGCNMRCAGWPCDTPHAIEPSLWKDDPKMEPTTILRDCIAQRSSTGAARVCLTGGEPLMQPADALRELIAGLIQHDFKLDVFSNGSFVYPFWLLHPAVTIVMDWKLSGSGEGSTKLEERLTNARQLRASDHIKFVVKSVQDLLEAESITNEFRDAEIRPQLWVGRVWGTELSDQDVVTFVQEHQMPWKLNIQTHKLIWPAETRGV